jgi:hypothetical protein
MRIDQNTSPLKKALAANASTASFASKVATIIEPVNDGVLNLRDSGGVVTPMWVKLLPYGLGADEDGYSLRLLGWQKLGTGPGPNDVLWIPQALAEVACVLSQAVGVAAAPLLNTERFADTITVTTQALFTDVDSGGASARGTLEVYSPTADLIAWFKVPIQGVEKLELQFSRTVGTPTMNCLYAYL